MRNNPIPTLCRRFEPTDFEYVFVCNKAGTINNIPIQQLFFMVEARYTFLPLDVINNLHDLVLQLANYFVFDQRLLEKIEITDYMLHDPRSLKSKVIQASRDTELFAKTLNFNATYVDLEQQIEWKPEEENILYHFVNIPEEIKNEFYIPSPIFENDDSIFLLRDGKTIFFRNNSYIYVFGIVLEDRICMRHYMAVEHEKKHNLTMYGEISFTGELLCRHTFDQDENFQFNRKTIFGPHQLPKLIEEVFNYDSNSIIESLISAGVAYDNNSFVKQRISESVYYGIKGANNETVDDDEFFEIGKGFDFEGYKDFYGY